MDEWIVALFSPAAFGRHMRAEWTDSKVTLWNMAQRMKPTLPAAHAAALLTEARRRAVMFRCGSNG